ncbi:hypothetical protein GCM10011371_29010 [Novosphingobium marinum]|uniref:DUF1254 domain-containing protein n=1 Tax=Novosphingobium marinum TaxID=1514948 RepID=A0A7Y9XY95_9SPHN|nr:DUF1214 domain-containing protein [Novosphingobium marinum]NYH96836.1 hypothetical protein [Novosphingobium marinum]GGC39860.1 hypothetical protein GCM10011371_29010 [Novosphingobium marinum]
MMRNSIFAALLSLGLAACARTPAVPTAVPVDVADTSEISEVARDVYVWGYPLVQAARIRLFSTNPDAPGSAAGLFAPINRFAHGRVLANPETKIGVGPNNDTLYSLARLDMEDGPFVLETPDFGDRYYTFSLNLADSSSIGAVGQRTHGGQLPPLFIHGSDYRGTVPQGFLSIASPTRYFSLAGRTVVRGEEEYPAVHSLQDRMRLVRYADYLASSDALPPRSPQSPLDEPSIEAPEGLEFLEQLGQVLRDWRVRDEDRPFIEAARRLGIGPRGFDPLALTGDRLQAAREGLRAGEELVLRRSLELGEQVNGWTTNYDGPRFGQDFELRAAVAKDQIFVAVPEEAVYPIGRVDSEGRLLDGRNSYRITMAAGETPPVDAFWSITLYDDRGFMVPNPIDRYSIGDRTKDLIRGSDGSVTIELSHTGPTDPQANWLPAPPGRFYLMMRLYRPRPEVLSRDWQPPKIERISG